MKSNKSSWRFIRWFITKVARSLMESPPEIEGVFTSIQSPLAIIRPIDNWPAMLNIHATQASQCFVEEVVHYKHAGGKQHEFLRFKVSHPAGPWKAFVFADRTVDLKNEDGEPSVSNKAAVLSTPAPSSSSASSAHSSREVPAYDAIYAATANSQALDRLHVMFLKDRPRTLRTFTFDTNDTRPTVPELATLLQVTSHSAPSYSAYHNQCYWFACTVYEALGQLFPNHTQAPDPRRSGTLRGIAIPMANSVQEVCEAYHRERAAILERAKEERERYEAAIRAQRAEALEEGREAGHEAGRAEERAVHERERERYEAVLRVEREQACEEVRVEERAALERERAEERAALERERERRAALERERAEERAALEKERERRAALERERAEELAALERERERRAALERERAEERAALERERAEERAALERERAEERAAFERERERYEAILRVEREQAREIREELAAQSRGAAAN